MASVIIFYALAALPFATLRANRIVQGEAMGLAKALPPLAAYGLAVMLVAVAAIAFFRTATRLRLFAALAAIAALFWFIGLAAAHLTPQANPYARVSPASGFWLLLSGLALLATDAIARLQPKPVWRIVLLCGALGLAGAFLQSGQWDDLSVLKEYKSRADIFWTEGARHLQLALGSLAAATLFGIPLGLACHKMEKLRGAVLNGLTVMQTVPSIALFGILIAPLGWIAATVPGAAALGIRGIGMAPAFVALFVYSLLPVVANTVVGLEGVAPAAREAARGLGMTAWQRLVRVEFPLAMPIVLTGIRIVMVQNIGLATVAALIGGGGFGVFVFQGIGQMAMDLVLLGTVPTVTFGFAAAIVLDALSDLNRKGPT